MQNLKKIIQFSSFAIAGLLLFSAMPALASTVYINSGGNASDFDYGFERPFAFGSDWRMGRSLELNLNAEEFAESTGRCGCGEYARCGGYDEDFECGNFLGGGCGCGNFEDNWNCGGCEDDEWEWDGRFGNMCDDFGDGIREDVYERFDDAFDRF